MANARLIVALAAQEDKRQEAREALQQAARASPEQLLEMAAGVGEVVQQSSADDRPVAAKLLLEALALLEHQRAKLGRPAQVRMDRLHADALLAAGREQESLAIAARLARENPDSAEIQESYASKLIASGDRAALQRGLDEWRRIAARSKPRSDRWLQAKYSVAIAQYKLGDVSSAVTLLRYMLETPPGLKDSAWEQRFEELLARCRQVESEDR